MEPPLHHSVALQNLDVAGSGQSFCRILLEDQHRFNKFLGNPKNLESSQPKEMGKAQEQAENLRAGDSETSQAAVLLVILQLELHCSAAALDLTIRMLRICS